MYSPPTPFAAAARCSLLETLPEGHQGHGFTCGSAELAAWPRSEIFAFAQDVRSYYGDLDPLLPTVERRDIVDGARLAVAGLYHAVAHTLMSEPEPEMQREGLRKMLFYAMLQTAYLRCGTFAATRAELLGLLGDDEAALLTSSRDSFFADILEWAAWQLRGFPLNAIANPGARGSLARRSVVDFKELFDRGPQVAGML